MTEIPAPLSIVTPGVRNVNGRGSFYRGQGRPELPVGMGGVRPALFPMNDVTEEAARGEITWLPRATYGTRGELPSRA